MGQNRYKDLENLLYTGFIPLKMKIGGTNLVLKSISDFEYDYIKLVSGVKEDPLYNFNFHIYYLYHSLFMVNGLSVFENSNGVTVDVIKLLRTFPNFLMQAVFDELDKLAIRLSNCSHKVEQYSLSSESRYNWRFRKKMMMNSSNATGIVGSDKLGLNQFQKFWMVLNINEDNSESFEEKYSLAKFLASFTDPKGVKKIESADKVRKEEEADKKERLRVIGTDEEVKFLSGPTDTRKGIVAELEKQMRGEKDEHDVAIEEYEKNLRMNMLSQMQEMKNIRDKKRKEGNFKSEEARAITAEEMAERLAKRHQTGNTFIDSDDNSSKAKFLQMSNVSDEEILTSSEIMTRQEYKELLNDDLFKSMHKTEGEDEKEISDKKYKKEQESYASRYDDDIDSLNKDFPNLRNK